MNRSLILVAFIVLCGCRQPKKEFPVPGKNEINAVLNAVISQQKIVIHYDDRGAVFNDESSGFKYNTLDSVPLSINLTKLTVIYDGNRSDDDIDTARLLGLAAPYQFRRTDISYIFFQNTVLKGIKVDRAAAPKSKFTNNAWLYAEWKNKHKVRPHYKLTVPIFSLNQQQAYVQIEAIFGFNIASCYGFMLKKVNGNWTIVWQHLRWIS